MSRSPQDLDKQIGMAKQCVRVHTTALQAVAKQQQQQQDRKTFL